MIRVHFRLYTYLTSFTFWNMVQSQKLWKVTFVWNANFGQKFWYSDWTKRMNKTQVESVQHGKTSDLNLCFQFPPMDRVKCGRLEWEWVLFLRLVGLVSVCAKFQLPSLSRSGLKQKVPGGVVWYGVIIFALHSASNTLLLSIIFM